MLLQVRLRRRTPRWTIACACSQPRLMTLTSRRHRRPSCALRDHPLGRLRWSRQCLHVHDASAAVVAVVVGARVAVVAAA